VAHSAVTFRPVVAVTATNAVFETSVGVIHRINDRTQFVVPLERGHPKVADDDVATLVTENFRDGSPRYWAVYRGIRRRRGTTVWPDPNGVQGWAVDRLQDYHDDGDLHWRQQRHAYNKTCEPNLRTSLCNRSSRCISPTFGTTDLRGTPTPTKKYYAAGPSRVTAEDGIHRCVHCDTRAASMRRTPTVRTAGPSPAPVTPKRSGWKVSRSVYGAVQSPTGSR